MVTLTSVLSGPDGGSSSAGRASAWVSKGKGKCSSCSESENRRTESGGRCSPEPAGPSAPRAVSLLLLQWVPGPAARVGWVTRGTHRASATTEGKAGPAQTRCSTSAASVPVPCSRPCTPLCRKLRLYPKPPRPRPRIDDDLEMPPPDSHSRLAARSRRGFDLEVTPWAPTRLTSYISHIGPEESSGASTLSQTAQARP